MPSESAHRLDDRHGDQWLLEIEWEELNGRNEAVAISLQCVDPEASEAAGRPVRKPKPITTSLLRSLRIGSSIEAARVEWAVALADLARQSGDERWTAEAERMDGPDRSKGGRPRLDHAEVVAAAEVYMQALGKEPTTAAVAKALNLSKGGADKRIARARAAGLIPPSGRGQS